MLMILTVYAKRHFLMPWTISSREELQLVLTAAKQPNTNARNTLVMTSMRTSISITASILTSLSPADPTVSA